MVAGLLGEVGEHGGESLPADRVRLVLLPHVAAHSWEFANCLTKRVKLSFEKQKHLQKSAICVSLVSSRKEIVEVFLGDDELDSPHIVRILSPPRPDLLHDVVVQGRDCVSHGLKCCPAQVTAICTSCCQHKFEQKERLQF